MKTELSRFLKRRHKDFSLQQKIPIGWEEWCGLPMLGLPIIKAKIDTGAKTSAIHAFHMELYWKKGKRMLRFKVNPIQRDTKTVVTCRAEVIDQRHVMSSNGHKENRYVIMTPLQIGNQEWPIELTLSNRDPLRFRMLLGREAMERKVIIDPHLSLCQGRVSKSVLKSIYGLPDPEKE